MAIREDFNLKYCTKPSVKREYFIMNKKCPVCQVALEIIGMIMGIHSTLEVSQVLGGTW